MGYYDIISIQGWCTLSVWMGECCVKVLHQAPCISANTKESRFVISITPFHNLTWFSCMVHLLSCIIESSGHQIDEVLCNTCGQTKSSDKGRQGWLPLANQSSPWGNGGGEQTETTWQYFCSPHIPLENIFIIQHQLYEIHAVILSFQIQLSENCVFEKTIKMLDETGII